MAENPYETPEDQTVQRDTAVRQLFGISILLVALTGIGILSTLQSPPDRVAVIGFSLAFAIYVYLRMRSGWIRSGWRPSWFK